MWEWEDMQKKYIDYVSLWGAFTWVAWEMAKESYYLLGTYKKFPSLQIPHMLVFFFFFFLK